MDTPRTCTTTYTVGSETRPCARPLRDHEQHRHACHPCETRMRGWLLRELPNQLVVLRGSLTPERAAGQYVTRTRTAPTPARLDVLSLLGPVAGDVIHDEHGDQTGPVSIATTLTSWVLLVAEERRLLGPAGRPSEERLAEWLGGHLDWCAGQPWVDELHADLGKMMRTVRGTTRAVPRRRPIDQPCPRCESMMLTEVDHQLYRECGECGSLYTAEELALAAAGWLAREAAA